MNYTPQIKDFGTRGSTLVDANNSATGTFYAMQVLQDAVIDTIESDIGRAQELLVDTSATLAAGTVIYVPIRRLILTSGIVLLYNGS